MSKEMFRHQFDSHWHTSFRLIDLAANLSEADYQGYPGYGHGSIHSLKVHLLQTDWSWHQALETGLQQLPLPVEGFPNLLAVKGGFQAEKAAWQNFLDGLAPEEVEAEIILTTRRGNSVEFPRWRILQHVVLHGMQHHSELARRLTEHRQSPGNIDFIFYQANPASAS